MLLENVESIDRVLTTHAAELGADLTAYRNHCYRVFNLCVALSPGDDARLEQFALATAFHDLGIWTARTFDYLPPSIALACDHLACTGQVAWRDGMTAMIREHHKVRAFHGPDAALVEPFRRADWIDVSRGALSFGLPRAQLRAIFARWPNAGFHGRLLQLAWRRFTRHPLSPIPVLRW